MGHETELKFIGPEDALARLRRSPVLRRFARNRRAETHKLNAVYFDTADFALRNAGLVLRVRGEGGQFVQTLKSSNGPNVATRTEIKAIVAEPAPDISAIDDEAMRRAVEKAVGKAELKPVFVVDMQRTSVVLTPRRGCEIEAAFDVGSIKTLGDWASSSLPISEFELELLKGTPIDLIACAREATAGLPLVLSFDSKAARGYALAEDRVDAPVSAPKVSLPAGATADDAFGTIVAHCLGHLLGNLTCVTRTRDPEGIHQMRVAMRRLRSALALFDGSFRASLGHIELDVRWLAGVLGEARDLDVFQEEVFRPAADAHGDDDRMLELATVVRTRRRIAWHDALQALESERFRKLALDLTAVTFERPWLDQAMGGAHAVELASTFARSRLAHKQRQALKRARRIDDLDSAERHELRKRLKKLRYAVEFFGSLFPKRRVRKYLKRISEVQDVLGEMNDAAVARALVRQILADNSGGEAAGAIGYAGGVVAGWHLGHARERAKKLEKRWRKFAKLKAPWG
jgi:triphosphatase